MPKTLRPTKVEINLKKLSHNLNVVKNEVGNRKIMAVMKVSKHERKLVEIMLCSISQRVPRVYIS